MERSHEYWMRAALRQAEKARSNDETPVGAILICQGRIVGRGRNQRENRQDVTLHAEMIAIRQASRHFGSWRLEDCTLYVTLEPCVMCAGAIVQARVSQVVFGALDPKAGACGSITNIFALPLNHQVSLIGGVLAEECSALLKSYFRERRQRDRAAGSKSARRAAAIRENKARGIRPARPDCEAGHD